MRKMRKYFDYLDELAGNTEYSYIISKTGPTFFNVPTGSGLAAFFSLEREEAAEVFKAWEKSRGWIHPNKDPKWLKRVAELEAEHHEWFDKALAESRARLKA